MSEETKPKELKLEVRADDDVANGVYANFIIANHSPTEFTLDFVFLPPQTNKAKVLSRVILNPVHAKRLQMLLDRQLQAYEQRFGEIPLHQLRGTKGMGDPEGFVN